MPPWELQRIVVGIDPDLPELDWSHPAQVLWEITERIRVAGSTSPLVRQTLMQEALLRLTDRDACLLLAYNALVQLERTHRQLTDVLLKTPLPPIRMKDPNAP